MPLTTVPKLEEHTQRTREVCIKMGQYITEAEYLLREWIGDGMYDAIQANTAHTYYARAQRAESLLTEMLALPDLNRRLTEQGGHVKNLGLDQMGNTNTLMSKNELDAYTSNLRARARMAVRDILLASSRVRRSEYTRV